MTIKTHLKHFWLFTTLLALFSVAFAAKFQKTPANTPVFAAKVLGLEGFQVEEIRYMVSEWESMGISQVFVLDHLYKEPTFRHSISSTSIKPWLIHQTFFSNHNDGAPKSGANPDWLAVTETGEYAKDTSKEGSWLVMACPNHKQYRQENIARAVKQVKKWQPYGLSIDFIRYFAFWELSHNHGHQNYDGKADPLSDTCFCPTCRDTFFSYINEKPPEGIHTSQQISEWIHNNRQNQWVAFKTYTITQMVSELVTAVKAVKPDIKINIHAVPWHLNEHDNAVHRITGQDVRKLAEHADIISPMAYAEMMQKPANWIHSLVKNMKQQCSYNCSVIPVFQVSEMYNSGEITDQEFRQYIESSLKSPSSGVVFWPWETLTPKQKAIIDSYTPQT